MGGKAQELKTRRRLALYWIFQRNTSGTGIGCRTNSCWSNNEWSTSVLACHKTNKQIVGILPSGPSWGDRCCWIELDQIAAVVIIRPSKNRRFLLGITKQDALIRTGRHNLERFSFRWFNFDSLTTRCWVSVCWNMSNTSGPRGCPLNLSVCNERVSVYLWTLTGEEDVNQ